MQDEFFYHLSGLKHDAHCIPDSIFPSLPGGFRSHSKKGDVVPFESRGKNDCTDGYIPPATARITTHPNKTHEDLIIDAGFFEGSCHDECLFKSLHADI